MSSSIAQFQIVNRNLNQNPYLSNKKKFQTSKIYLVLNDSTEKTIEVFILESLEVVDEIQLIRIIFEFSDNDQLPMGIKKPFYVVSRLQWAIKIAFKINRSISFCTKTDVITWQSKSFFGVSITLCYHNCRKKFLWAHWKLFVEEKKIKSLVTSAIVQNTKMKSEKYKSGYGETVKTLAYSSSREKERLTVENHSQKDS